MPALTAELFLSAAAELVTRVDLPGAGGDQVEALRARALAQGAAAQLDTCHAATSAKHESNTSPQPP